VQEITICITSLKRLEESVHDDNRATANQRRKDTARAWLDAFNLVMGVNDTLVPESLRFLCLDKEAVDRAESLVVIVSDGIHQLCKACLEPVHLLGEGPGLLVTDVLAD